MYLMFNVLCQIVTIILIIKIITRIRLTNGLIHIDCDSSVQYSYKSGPPIIWHTGRFIMFSVITNIYNKKTKGPILMDFFIATGKLKKFLFDN